MKHVYKKWGYEKWLFNRTYCVKLLTIKKSYRCSLHYHKIKDELFYIVSGLVLIELGQKKQTMKPGQFVRIPPGKKHRFTGKKNSLMIECSTHHFENDSYRIEQSGAV